jgi:4-hydroxybutyryl-CoA dehydratase/vinylacetyl-CoA-Delta-isomerase
MPAASSISGTKAIVTGAPYMHELLVMPCRQMGEPTPTSPSAARCRWTRPASRIVARPAGRPGDKLEHGAALFSRRYGQSTAVVMFDRVFVPWERVFYAGEWEHSPRADLRLRHAPPAQLHRRARGLR